MCEALERLINDDLKPFLKSACSAFEREGDTLRVAEIEELLQSLNEMVEDIRNGVMDSWECGELYEEFKTHRESGDFLDKIS
ncbi:hypothetical protein [Hydrogenimonas sp.]